MGTASTTITAAANPPSSRGWRETKADQRAATNPHVTGVLCSGPSSLAPLL